MSGISMFLLKEDSPDRTGLFFHINGETAEMRIAVCSITDFISYMENYSM